MTSAAFINQLKSDPDLQRGAARWEVVPAAEGIYRDFPVSLNPRIIGILEKRGISRLYSHQYDSYAHVASGRNITVVTPTASGKTLCYNLPVLDGLLARRDARALYLFPTKALSQDQQSELNEIVLGGELGIKVSTYDGDTPSSVRVSARDSGRIVISNPDMLHSGILPNHPKWIKFLSNLSYVVIDEVHSYRGVFGSHMTNLIRRLKRIAAFYGASPRFICASATIGNPGELAEWIIEEETVLIDNNGAPRGEKHIILYNPPYVDQVQGIRRGTVNESQNIAIKFLKAGVKTIVFARSRVRTELIAAYINERLANHYTQNARIRVESYRGGYLPNERRAVEKGLRDGTIQGVVSTNALELGIDIGGLDAAVLAGFPGSISSVWQQAGRAGRRASTSVAVIVASSAPIDQYMISHPEYVLGRNPESAWIDPSNPYILSDHLKCAVFELPFADGESFGTVSYDQGVHDVLAMLEEDGILRHTEGRWYWSDRSYPAETISLRSATAENVVIINTTAGKNAVIGEMDRPSAKELIYDGAVYLHRGDQYFVEHLDIENRRCYVSETKVNFYTDAVVKTDIKVLSEDFFGADCGVQTLEGDVLVRTQTAKFKKIRFHTHENVGYGEISLPEEQMHTRAFILIFSGGTKGGDSFSRIPAELQELVIAHTGTLIRNIIPLLLMCDRSDIRVAERLRDPHVQAPSLYVYDAYPGGIGLAEGTARHLSQVLKGAWDLVRNCGCENGCPSCIGPEDPGPGPSPYSDSALSRKEAVLVFLEGWLGGELLSSAGQPTR
ncbi:MAG: DEAD/DEAH box helicase [Spirochaetales bacterium]|nr:DEAD/DEAH box helicase [Spirochaetales bacterium]